MPRKKIPASIRQEITEKAKHRCSYCRGPEIVGIPMVMEHIIPLSGGGTSNADNLCLACYRCNEFKGAKTHALDPQTGKTIPLFNPNKQIWREHFSWSDDGLQVVGKTSCGRATIKALRLNNKWQIQARRIWMLIGLHPPLD